MAKQDPCKRTVLWFYLVVVFCLVLVNGVVLENNLKRYGEVTLYHTRIAIKTVQVTALFCCSGWQRKDNICATPICASGCNNGGYCVARNKCLCKFGWKGPTCSQDINECSSNNGGCEQTCINRIGQRNTCICGRGYNTNIWNSKKCTDINECDLRVCNCARGSNEDCGANCTNTRGSYTCSCAQGYKLRGSATCVDFNECAVNKGGCLFQCVNLPGSFRCVCRRGFRMVRGSCQDVDECANSNGYCEHICQNVIGRHRCRCKEGFVLDGNRKTCSDVDECSIFHGCDNQCHNTVGGFFCSCSKGYELSNDNRTCTDVDECVIRNIVGTNKTSSLADCQQKCLNSEGSFLCACNDGFKLMYDNKRCADVDECKHGAHHCDHNCHNTYGSYRCTCRVGFKIEADGRTCEGLPCEQIVSPRHGAMTCSGLVTNSTCTFSCSPGYNLDGSQSRTCQASSSWDGNRTSCEAKHCDELVPRLLGQSISLPCFTSFGSKCYFGCAPGFFLEGDRLAKCSLSSRAGNVSWKIGQFICKEIQTCNPSPCEHGGNCSALDETRFTCDCEGTGYKGDKCQTGFITAPTFTKLHPKTKSNMFSLVARPANKLKVSLYSDMGITFEPSSSMDIKFPRTKQGFTVEAEKPGIVVISYSLDGPSKDDFEIPEQSVVLVASQISNSDSLYTKLFLLKKGLPIGCEQRSTNLLGCEMRFASTAPWTGSPLSTRGIVHIAIDKHGYIPLSLIGLSLEDLQLNREKIIEATISITSSDRDLDISYLNSGTCSIKKESPDTMLELMEADTFVSSFLNSFTKMSPEWLQLVLGEASEVFDIQNVFVNLASTLPRGLEDCAGLPTMPGSSVAYYRPVVNYKLHVGQDKVSLLADGKTCFAINVCKPAVFIHFPKIPATKLKNTLQVFREMKERGFDLHVDSIGLLSDIATSEAVEGVFWNGTHLRRTSSFSYNMWLKGQVEWKMQIPGQLRVTLKITGESFIYYDSLNALLFDRLSRPLEFQLKGKTSVTVRGRILGQDLTIETKTLQVVGKAKLGGAARCSDNIQGIFVSLGKSVGNVFINSPLAPYVRPMKNQPVHLAVFISARGGKQDQIENKREILRTLTNMRFLVPELEQILQDSKAFLPKEKIALEKWIKLSQDFRDSISAIRRMLFRNNNIDLTKLRQLIIDINNNIYDSKKIVELLRNRLAAHIDKQAVSELIIMLEDLQFGFPSSLPVEFGGKMVQLQFHGISLHSQASLCMQRLCFDEINTTVEYLAENSCVSSPSPASSFNVIGKASRMISLSPGEIVTMSSGEIIKMGFDRNSEHVSALFQARIRLLGVNQLTNVTLDKTQLSFQTEGSIFQQFPTEMNVVAKVKRAWDWNSLVFSVNGKMVKTSSLPSLLENRIQERTHVLADNAEKRIQNAKNAVKSAKRRTEEAKQQTYEKEDNLDVASKELRNRVLDLTEKRLNYSMAKLKLNNTLMYYIKLNNKTVCELQNCSYIFTNTCIPKVCRDSVTVKYSVPKCDKHETEVTVDVVVQENKQHFYEKKTFRTQARGGCGWLEGTFSGCDKYNELVEGPKEKVPFEKLTIVPKTKKQTILVFTCNQMISKSVISDYSQAYECCSTKESESVQVLDPQCVIHNTDCFQNMTELANDIRNENYTLYEEFQDMQRKGEQMSLAQLSVNKAQAKVDFASNQLDLVRAFHKQQEYAEDAVNVTRLKSREELGLRLGEKMRSLGVNSLVSVDGLSFSIAVTSRTKMLFPLVASLKTADGKDRTIEFPMDFKKNASSLDSASKRIIRIMYGPSGSRKRRSTREEADESVLDDADFEAEQSSCLFSQKANIFFAAIIDSLQFITTKAKELDKAMAASVHGFDKLSFQQGGAKESGNNGSHSTSPSHQLRTAFIDMIQSFKESHYNSSVRIPWNTTLENWRGYLDVVTKENNFTECSGSQDCVDYFFGTLKGLYEFEYNPRAEEIKHLLQELEKVINRVLEENHPLTQIEEMISQAKFVINKTNDETILCGTAPVIVKSSPAQVFALEGETVELTCDVVSTIEVEYLWQKNGRVIDDSSRSSLVLRNVTLQSEGAYKCEVSNNRGRTISNVTMVVVHQMPNITDHPRSLLVLLGSPTASMVCKCTGSPPPITEWFYTPLNHANQVLPLNFTEPVLTLFDLTMEDAGFYYCYASNSRGKVKSRVARLDVLGFTPGTPRVAVAIKFAQCVAPGEFPSANRSNCSDNDSSPSQHFDSEAFIYTFKKIIRYLDWSPSRIEAFKYSPSPNASISFVVNGYEPTIPGDAIERYVKALDEFSKSRRNLSIELQSLQSALKDGKLKFHWKNVLTVGRVGSLEVEGLIQKCPIGKEAQNDGFLCTDCLPGSYGLRNGTCLPCPVGTYQPDQGRANCLYPPCKESEIPLIANIREPQRTTESYRNGEYITLGCQPGYKGKGNATLLCKEGNWTTSDFHCERTCYPPWTELNKRCYKVINVPTGRWKDALGKCRSLQSNMTVIGSQTENHFVANLAKSQIKRTETIRIWLGLRKVNATADFKWGDGSRPDNYTNWGPGEPNNLRNREHCTEMLITNTIHLGKWNDIDCDDRRFKSISVCERALRGYHG